MEHTYNINTLNHWFESRYGLCMATHCLSSYPAHIHLVTIFERALYAGTVKHHNVCNCHVAIDTRFQTNSTYHFSPFYLNGIKIVTAFKYNFEETMPKLSVNFGNHISQISHKNQYPSPVCNFDFTAPQ